jgi:hypothetical protein
MQHGTASIARSSSCMALTCSARPRAAVLYMQWQLTQHVYASMIAQCSCKLETERRACSCLCSGRGCRH